MILQEEDADEARSRRRSLGHRIAASGGRSGHAKGSGRWQTER